ncbi:F0F1 ATP synthase subunit epsilon [Rhodovulum sulfidophilum]|uniref:F0F1 ATP synthase subunit epsilon n=1 Tax=Rhodovulum visakhapatnamense TaxID=364297 RepID=UPI0009519DF1|nr:F0F1 ATP synthase subunit epsilon [Rhodovulum visakhapatnamense]OLS44732.1 F0F1 ATP synthase subunit epsilon [Rhodovulum sulfidophilum]
MNLRIVTPLSIVVDAQIDALRAEDASGSFGILSGHAPFLTALTVCIVSWKTDATERFCAVRSGMLSVIGDTVSIATREAVAGDDLATLDTEVLQRFQTDADAEKVDRNETVQLQLNAIRQMVTRLHGGADRGAFR